MSRSSSPSRKVALLIAALKAMPYDINVPGSSSSSSSSGSNSHKKRSRDSSGSAIKAGDTTTTVAAPGSAACVSLATLRERLKAHGSQALCSALRVWVTFLPCLTFSSFPCLSMNHLMPPPIIPSSYVHPRALPTTMVFE